MVAGAEQQHLILSSTLRDLKLCKCFITRHIISAELDSDRGSKSGKNEDRTDFLDLTM